MYLQAVVVFVLAWWVEGRFMRWWSGCLGLAYLNVIFFRTFLIHCY